MFLSLAWGWINLNIPVVNRQIDILEKLLGEMGTKNGFIEVGCGEGHILEVLSRMGLKGIGIDFSEDAIKLARSKNLNNIELINANFYDVEIKNKDLVLLLFVIEHIEDDHRALKKINSFLKLGRHLIISVPAHSKLYSYQDRLAGHYRRYDRKDILEKLNNAGFKVKKFLSFGFPVSNIYILMYNFVLSFSKSKNNIMIENTKITGIKSENVHFPYLFRIISKIVFPILSLLIKLDFLFLNTDLGTHYIILAKKIENIG